MRVGPVRVTSTTGRATLVTVLAGAVMLVAAGCNFISPQATLKHYDASDGTSVTVGDIKVRNAIALTGDDGTEASLSMTVINSGTDPARVSFEYPTADGSKTQVLEVDGSAEVRRGTQPGDDQLILTDLDAKPGALLPVYVQYGTETGKKLMVPVLTGALPEYSTLLPTSTPSGTPAPGGSSTPLPESTEDAPSGTPSS
ncbi:hypothetical protein ACPEEZ_02990 [Frigoribacterium sp. 2-23]|uniref:hypothetical protein n=1 Tax=Frigoribacterium sp. 2-23 TaxID=3415006 RepID=UPI003C6F3146